MISQAEITREILGNIPAWMAYSFYVMVAAACFWTAVKFAKRFRQHRRGLAPITSHPSTVPGMGRRSSPEIGEPREATQPQVWRRLPRLLRYLIFHKQLLRDRYAGVAHLLLFYGFTILFIGTCLVFLEHDTPLHFFYGSFYLIASLIIDLGGVAFLIGLAMFVYRRMFGNSERILRRFYVASLLWILLIIGVTGFALEGARIAIDRPPFERWSVIGELIAMGLNLIGVEGRSAQSLHRFLWGFHACFCIAFFGLLPWRFFSHIVFAPVSWASRSNRPRSSLRPFALPIPNPIQTSELHWNHLQRIDLLQADACTTCGRCNSVCPAQAAGKSLSPRDIVLGIRESMNSPDKAVMDFIDDDAIWSCTTCAACNEACPIGIEIYDKIVDLRRGQIESGAAPVSSVRTFDSLIDHFNPYEKSNENRLDWSAGIKLPIAAENEKIELLYWIGCAGSFDSDGNRVSRAMIKILKHLDIDFHVLGKRERCTGDPARRMGEEGLFQELAKANLEMLKHHGVAKILTHCPHCFNVFKNEYPQLAALSFSVEHHSQFLARMIDAGTLKLSTEYNKKITYHDPCYLSRGNGETMAPRSVIGALPMVQSVEMPRNGCNSSCCGAGGGSLWLDIKGTNRIENQRAKEAADTAADLIVTGCPFCKSMLEAGRQSFDNQLGETMDLAELVAIASGL